MTRFRTLSEHGLAELADDDVLAYVRAARAAGRLTCARVAVQLLVFRHERRVRARVALRVAEHFVESLTDAALVRAIGASFDRDTPGEFLSWLDTIVRRTIADFYRSPAGRTARLETGLEPDDGQAVVDFPHERLEAADAFGRALATLDNAMHREVIDLYEIHDLLAGEVAERVGTSENNVHAISSRFRRTLRTLLVEEGAR